MILGYVKHDPKGGTCAALLGTLHIESPVYHFRGHGLCGVNLVYVLPEEAVRVNTGGRVPIICKKCLYIRDVRAARPLRARLAR